MANSVAQYLMAHARQYGLDPRAVIAVARQEGLGGGVGDHGTSFGPFQLHEGGALPRGIPLGQAQAWAESPAGLNYALSRIASVARGLSGRQAISAIVSRFEHPANIPGEIAGAESAYGGGLGSSPALSVLKQVTGGGGGSSALGMSPQQLMSEYLLQQAQTALSGNSATSPAQEGAGLLQMAMARKALQATSGGSGSTPSYGGKNSAASIMQSGGYAGGFLPKGALYKPGRKDQGQDGQTNPGGAILAPGAGYVVAVKSDPNGFGPRYPVVHFTSGPYAGHDIYLGHTLSALSPGSRFAPGTVLSHTGTRGIGNATVPGWFEIGFAPGGLPGAFGQSVPF